MEEKKNVLDAVLDKLSGGTDQPAENGDLQTGNNQHRNSGKQVPGGNEDILDPKRQSILD